MMKNLIVAVIFTLVSLAAAEGGLALLGYGALYKSGISRLHDPHLLYRLPPSFAPDIDLNVEKLIFIGFKTGKLYTTAVGNFIAHLPENLLANKFCGNKTG